MAISYARLEFVKRSSGKNVCTKAAYNSRDKVIFEGTKFSEKNTYDWGSREKPIYHDILLPNYVDKSFKSMDKLWNLVEASENRHNSQVAMEMVVALPDDQVISVEDRIELSKRFAEEIFVKNGFAVQVDIHQPEKKVVLSPETGEISHLDHNWHVHFLSPTRRFDESGLEFHSNKARDFMPDVRKGFVVHGKSWQKTWTEIQNSFFSEKGLDLRVDENGIVSQKHIGPVRLRARVFFLEEENRKLDSLNKIESCDSEKILEKITETRSVFTAQDVDRFLAKHTDPATVEFVRSEFWNHGEIVPLFDFYGQKTGKFSTQKIVVEEKKLLRISDSIQQKPAFRVDKKTGHGASIQLNNEQKSAFDRILDGKRLSCIEGHAGTGKSYLLSAIAEAYGKEGYIVRSFGPDNATAAVLREKGLPLCDNVYRFLFSVHHEKISISRENEVWIIDESGKMGNRPLLEVLKLAQKNSVQLIFSGCSSQIASVDRGGMFKRMCDRYSSVELCEIQRQKTADQRAMTQSLAYGEMGAAIDCLVNLGGLRWSETREEAIESLVKAWSNDRTIHPYDSSLIIAHSNSEVRLLNQMARVYRREKGELGGVEFECKTIGGKIIVSVGDKIEFRKNEKTLSVTNGMFGILVEASEEKFVVRVKDVNVPRDVVFDPKSFNGFQLGYATTYFRSQGQTVDRAYVLHSPQTNKEKFYVGLTRHVREAQLFICREQARSLSELKYQSSRREDRENTVGYLTEQQLVVNRERVQRNVHIQELKTSHSFMEKAKGYVLNGWETIRDAIFSRLERVRDTSPNHEFFHPRQTTQSTNASAIRIEEEIPIESTVSQGMRTLFRSTIEKGTFSRSEHESNAVNCDCLPLETTKLLKEYYGASKEAETLFFVVQAEAIDDNLKLSAHFKEWQVSCGVRNEKASYLMSHPSRDVLSKKLSEKAFHEIQERAERHYLIQKNQTEKQPDLSSQLKENFESLLQQLFPEGPTGKDSRGFRFGGKGSISVICQGERLGSFYDFERGEGGGPIKLIGRALSLEPKEAVAWAKNFVGSNLERNVPINFKFKIHSKNDGPNWKCFTPSPSFPAPSLKEIVPSLNRCYVESARHAYRDLDGNLLFYQLRLIDRQDQKKKIFLPLSYGQWEGSKSPCWAIKTYESKKRTLYGLEQLLKDPNATILVVEGEKTADAAKEIFKDEKLICVTWQGGASSVSKTDWNPICGRNVVIWPDNDAAGFKASQTLCSELRKVGVSSLKIVTADLLQSFPEKWDLADPIPSGKKLHDIVLMARSKTVGIEQAYFLLESTRSRVDEVHALSILARVEERLWQSLEDKYSGNTTKVHNDMLRETKKHVVRQDYLYEKLNKDYGLQSDFSKRLAYQVVLVESETGKFLSDPKILELKEALSSQKTIRADSLEQYIFDRSVSDFASISLTKSQFKHLSALMYEHIDISHQYIPQKQASNNQSLSLEM